jgi:putative sugar O-methyltransferase
VGIKDFLRRVVRDTDRAKRHYQEIAARHGPKPEAELSAINRFMLRNYVAARRDYARQHKSAHWDLFPDDFAPVIQAQDAWADFRLNGISVGYDSRLQVVTDCRGDPEVRDERVIKNWIRYYDSLATLAGEEYIRRYHECDVGNPPFCRYKGLKINPVDFHTLYIAWRIKRHAPYPDDVRLVIADIGGGYGGLLAKLRQFYPNSLCLGFDLPEVNAAQAYYLMNRFEGARFFGYTDLKEGGMEACLGGDYDFAVLPGWTTAQLPRDSVDVFINSQSMMEMNFEVIAGYFEDIQRSIKCGGLFYCGNRYTKKTVGENIRIKDYPYDDRWHFVRSGPVWEQLHVHELVAVRTRHANAFGTRVLLEALPPRTLGDVGRALAKAARDAKVLIVGDRRSVNPGLRYAFRNANRVTVRYALLWVKERPALYHRLKRLPGLKALKWLIARIA